MTHVACRLTAKNRDQLRNPTLGNRVWASFTFTVELKFQRQSEVSQCTRRRANAPWSDHMGLVVTHTHPGPHGSGSDSHARWSDRMGLVVTHTHPGPHRSGSDSHARWSDHMGLVVTHTHPGPHGSGSDSHAPWSDHMGLVVTHTHPGVTTWVW